MQFQKIMIVCSVVIGILAILWLLLFFNIEESLPHVLRPRNEGYSFDYIVVGAGTAGSVLASLLANHGNHTVLLVEAGNQFGFLSKIPLLTTFQQKGINDWAFFSVPQKHSSKGLENQRQALPRGKGIGGSAQLNYMLHFDGLETDFNNWASQYNLEQWDWKSVKPFLQAANPKTIELLKIHKHYSKLTEALDQAKTEFSHKPWVFRASQYNIKNGLRHSVLHRFLQPALKNNDNLRLLINTIIKKIHLQTTPDNELKAITLTASVKDDNNQSEHIFKLNARREIIICAGAYQSPQLLLASGIGAENKLKNLQISQQHNLPHVGENLHDHFNLPLWISIDVIGPTLNQRSLLDPLNLFNYLHSGSGHFGNFGVLGHIDSRDSDYSFGLTFFGAGAIDETALMSISNFKREHFRALFPRYNNRSQEGFIAISSCLQPKSRGTVNIKNESIRKNPLIDPNYLSDVWDVNCTIRAVRASVEVITSSAFQKLRPHIHWPTIKECIHFVPIENDFVLNKPSDLYLNCIMRHLGLTSHHPGGTCRMGRKASDSVVDQQFRVHGIKNLRVVDASILPTPISGNPNSIIIAMAIRASTMILRDNLKDY